MVGFIYKIVNALNGDFYLGSTPRKPSKRESEHFLALKGRYHINTHLQNAWNLYGGENFKFEIYEQIDLSHFETKIEAGKYLLFIELERIKSLNPHYNIARETRGGRLGINHSEITKEKIRIKNTGRKHTQEEKEKIRLGNTGKILSSETIAKIKETLRGRNVGPGYIRTEEHNEKNRRKLNREIINKTGIYSEESQFKRKNNAKIATTSDEFRRRASLRARNRNRRSFSCYRKSGEFVGEFTSQAEAAELLGDILPKDICNNLRGHQKTAKGYIFKYK